MRAWQTLWPLCRMCSLVEQYRVGGGGGFYGGGGSGAGAIGQRRW